jgi:hypothetical protein
MGRPRKNLAAEVLEGEEPSSEEMDLDEFLEEIGPSTACVHVLRMKPDGSRPQLGKTTMESIREDPWEYLRGTYGPGKYLLFFRGSDRRIKGSKVIEVDGIAQSTNGSSPAIGGLPSSDNLGFHDKLLLYNFISQSKNNSNNNSLNIGEMLAGLAAIMTAIRPSDGAKPVDPLAMFQSIVTMYQGLKPKEEKSELDRLRETASVIKEFSGEGKGGIETGWDALASVGKDAIDKLSPLLTGVAGARVPATVNTSTVPGRPAVSSVPQLQGVVGGQNSPAERPATGAEDLQRWLVAQLQFFKTKAIAGKDPNFWIDYIFENQEEPGCQAILYAIRQGATFENLLSFDAEIGQNPQLTLWFRQLYDALKSELSGDVDSGGEGRNTGDTPSNGGTGASGLPRAANPAPSTNVS